MHAPTLLRPARALPWSDAAGIVAVLVLGVLIVVPVAVIALSSVVDGGVTLEHYRAFAQSRALLTATANSLVVAAGIAALSVVIGTPLAFGVARSHMRGKGLVRAAVVLSLVSPEFLVAMGYVLLAGPNAGYVNVLLRDLLALPGRTGPFDIFSLGGLVLTALPNGVAFVFLALTPALANMDPALEDAARLRGASPLRAVRDITLPLMRPAILAGTLLAFATSLAMYGPPEMLGIPVLTVAIREAMLGLDFAAASVAAVILVALSAAALLLQRVLTANAERYRTLSGKAFSARRLDLGRATHALTALGIAYVAFALVLPYGTMLAVSLMKSVGNGFASTNFTLANYATVLGDRSIRKAALLSLTLAASTAAIVATLGVVVGWLIVRTRFRARVALDYISVLPLALPGTALAFALIVIYLNWPGNLLGFYGTPAILLVAYLARFVPLGVRNSQTTLVQISPELEEASRLAGAGEAGTLLRITVPLLAPAILYTFVLVFVLAIPELSASIILRGFATETVATSLLAVWNGNGGLAVASAYGIAIFVFVSALIGAATLVAHRTGAGRLALDR